MIFVEDRFRAKYEIAPSGCWIWTAGKDRDGYGLFWCERRNRRAHRFAYELFVGPIPEGLQLDHLCRTVACVNPEHLEPVTCRENILRGEGVCARNAVKTHCPKGHEYTPENICPTPLGGRRCKKCMAIKARAYYLKQKALAS